MEKIELLAQLRDKHGRGASRRLRLQGKVPGIVYGSDGQAVAVSFDHNTIYHALKREDFHTSIFNIKLGEKKEQVLLRDYQLHPFRQQVLHLDLQRVNDKEEIHMSIPLHFINENVCYAVKMQNAHITHVNTEIEVRALAKNMPHFIDVDLQDLKAGQTLHLSDLKLPHGVTSLNLLRNEDLVIASAAGISEEIIEENTVNVAAADIPTVNKKEEKAE